jgi:hypothetical protein
MDAGWTDDVLRHGIPGMTPDATTNSRLICRHDPQDALDQVLAQPR